MGSRNYFTGRVASLLLAVMVWVSFIFPLTVPVPVFAEEIIEPEIEVLSYTFNGTHGLTYRDVCTQYVKTNERLCLRTNYLFPVNVETRAGFVPYEEFFVFDWDAERDEFVLYHNRTVNEWDNKTNTTNSYVVKDVYQRISVTTSEQVILSPIIKPFPGGFEFGVEGNALSPVSVSFTPSLVDGARVVNGLKRISANGSVFVAEDMRKNGEVSVTGNSFSVVVEGPFEIDPLVSLDYANITNDGYADEANPSTVFNGESLAVSHGAGTREWTFIEGNHTMVLGDVSISLIEANITVWCNTLTTGGVINLFEVEMSGVAWDETTMDWDAMPGTINETNESSQDVQSTGAWFAWSIMGVLNESMTENNETFTILLRGDSDDAPELSFSSAENSISAERPKIYIYYSVNTAPQIFPEPFDTDLFYDDVFNVTGGFSDADDNIENFTIVLESPSGTNYTYPTNFTVLHNFDSATGYVTPLTSPADWRNSIEPPVFEATIKKEGIASFNVSSDASEIQGNRSSFQWFKTGAGVDLTNFTDLATGVDGQENGSHAIWIHLPDLAYLRGEGGGSSTLWLEIATNVTNRIAMYSIPATSLVQGWNLLHFKLTGTHQWGAVDWTNISHFSTGVYMSHTADVDFDTFYDYWVAYDSDELYWNGTDNFQVGQRFNETGTWTYFLEVNDTYSNNITSSTFSVGDYFNVSVDYEPFVLEGNTYDINLTVQVNDSKITGLNTVNFTWNNTVFDASLLDTTVHGVGITNYTWGYAQFPINLVYANESNATLNFSYVVDYVSLTDKQNITSDVEQSVMFSGNVTALNFFSPAVELQQVNLHTVIYNYTSNVSFVMGIEWNNTNYTLTWNGSNHYTTVTVPDLDESIVINVTAWMTLTYNSTSRVRTTGNGTLLAKIINITTCTTGNITLNISNFDEINLTMQPVNMSVLINQGPNSFGFNVDSVTFQEFCLDPNETNIEGNVTIFYEGDFFVPRNYYTFAFNLSNTPRNITLYSLNRSRSHTVVFYVENEDGLAYSGVYLQAQKWYLYEDLFRTVAMCKSDDQGDCEMNLELGKYYKFLVFDAENDTVFATEYQYINTTSKTIPVRVGYGEGYLIGEGNVVKSWVFNESTGLGTLIFSTIDGTSVTLNINVTYFNGSDFYNYSGSVNSVTRVIDFLNISDLAFFVDVWAVNSEGYPVPLVSEWLDYRYAVAFGSDILLGLFLLVSTVALVGLGARNSSVAVFGVVAIIYLASAMRMLPVPTGAVWGLAILGVIVVAVVERG